MKLNHTPTQRTELVKSGAWELEAKNSFFLATFELERFDKTGRELMLSMRKYHLVPTGLALRLELYDNESETNEAWAECCELVEPHVIRVAENCRGLAEIGIGYQSIHFAFVADWVGGLMTHQEYKDKLENGTLLEVAVIKHW